MKNWCWIVLLLAAPAAEAQQALPAYARERYVRVDHMIPMRDGKRLFTSVYCPRDSAQAYPILLTRTPYASDGHLDPFGPAEVFAKAGYIFAFQDVRGKYQSEGAFVDVRPYRPVKRDSADIDETTDTYDTIDWLVKHVPGNNGRVGQYGISYLGFYSTMGLIDAHPTLKAVSPQAPVTNWFIGDDWHHNGAFFLADGFDFVYSFGVPRPVPTTRHEPDFDYGTPDSYDFFLKLGPIRNVDEKYFRGRIPYWNELLAHGTYDAYWKARDPLPHVHNVRPAVLTVGGWFDAEDLWGTLHVYHTVERTSPSAYNILVMGPWEHAGWYLSDGASFGDLRFGNPTADYYHEHIELPFFEHFLKDKGPADLPEASVYETGTNRWRSFDAWPPKGVETKSLYFRPGGKLGFERPPLGGSSFDEYVSDPARPVPYVDGVVVKRPAEYMAADQRFAARRPDVLVYQTDPLTEDLTIAGPITADLFVATSGTDADWVVKLIDVYPDNTPDPDPNPRNVRMGGYQQLVRGDIMRGKFRSSYERPEPFVPGKPTPVKIAIPDALHTFRAGHRVMVQVQSSWFPLVDRNPQRFVDISRARESDFQKATQRVYHAGALSSRLEIGVLR